MTLTAMDIHRSSLFMNQDLGTMLLLMKVVTTVVVVMRAVAMATAHTAHKNRPATLLTKEEVVVTKGVTTNPLMTTATPNLNMNNTLNHDIMNLQKNSMVADTTAEATPNNMSPQAAMAAAQVMVRRGMEGNIPANKGLDIKILFKAEGIKR